MCLVEIEGMPKLELACSTVVREGLKVRTRSPQVVEARRGVLEFLLAEHPAGLPDLRQGRGVQAPGLLPANTGCPRARSRRPRKSGRRRFQIGREAPPGPGALRPLHALRPVPGRGHQDRASSGVFERGIHSEIAIYEAELVDNNYSGNLVDICPVGAITDTEFRFKTRAWFLERRNRSARSAAGAAISSSIIIPAFRASAANREDLPGPAAGERRRQRPLDLRLRPLRLFVDLDQKDRIENSRLEQGDGKTESELGQSLSSFSREESKPSFTSGRTRRIGLVLTSWLTNEELFLIKKIFKEEPGRREVFLRRPAAGSRTTASCSPPSGRRTARRAGARASTSGRLTSKTLAGDRTFFSSSAITDRRIPAERRQDGPGDGSRPKSSSRPHETGLESPRRFRFPGRHHLPRKDGSLTNADGQVQTFRRRPWIRCDEPGMEDPRRPGPRC